MNMIMWHGPGGGGRGGRGRRVGSAAAARVGLTDGTNGTAAASMPPPSESEGPQYSPRLLWANTRTTWHGFRRVLALVWESNALLTGSLALLNLAQGALPAARVWISKLLIDEVVNPVKDGTGATAL